MRVSHTAFSCAPQSRIQLLRNFATLLVISIICGGCKSGGGASSGGVSSGGSSGEANQSLASSTGLKSVKPAYFMTQQELDNQRSSAWRPANPYWEVVYDGKDTPADNVPGAFMWDNPIDDDWSEPYWHGYDHVWVPFRTNTYFFTSSPGFLTIDRTFAPFRTPKTGAILRRDEWLDPNFVHANFGFTMEAKLKLLSASEKEAFNIWFVGRDCTVALALSGPSASFPYGSMSSGEISGGHTNHFSFETTSNMFTLRLVRAALSTHFDVFLVSYADINATRPAQYQKIHSGECNSAFRVGAAPNILHPYVQLGSSDSARSPAFILDFARYRRDAIYPDAPLQSLQPRVPPALPIRQPAANMEYLFHGTYAGVYSGAFWGDAHPNDSAFKSQMGEQVTLRGSDGGITPSPLSGVYNFNSGTNLYPLIEIMHPKGLKDKGDFTIEARLRVAGDSGERGFRITHLDTLGAVSFYISRDKVETALGLKPAGFLAYPMNTTNAFHTYRLVRKAGELYAHLYVDNDPVPKIVDQHLSYETENYGSFDQNPYIQFATDEVFPKPGGWPMRRTNGNVDVDYIRWYGFAFAP